MGFNINQRQEVTCSDLLRKAPALAEQLTKEACSELTLFSKPEAESYQDLVTTYWAAAEQGVPSDPKAFELAGSSQSELLVCFNTRIKPKVLS